MALRKEINKEDGTKGEYIRLVCVQFPGWSKTHGYGKANLGFDVYLNEDAAKKENKAIFSSLNISIDMSFFSEYKFENNIMDYVYTHHENIPELADAEDVLDTI